MWKATRKPEKFMDRQLKQALCQVIRLNHSSNEQSACTQTCRLNWLAKSYIQMVVLSRCSSCLSPAPKVTTRFQWEDTIKQSSLKPSEFPSSLCRLCSLRSEKQRNQDILLHVFLLRM